MSGQNQRLEIENPAGSRKKTVYPAHSRMRTTGRKKRKDIFRVLMHILEIEECCQRNICRPAQAELPSQSQNLASGALVCQFVLPWLGISMDGALALLAPGNEAVAWR